MNEKGELKNRIDILFGIPQGAKLTGADLIIYDNLVALANEIATEFPDLNRYWHPEYREPIITVDSNDVAKFAEKWIGGKWVQSHYEKPSYSIDGISKDEENEK